MVKGINTYLIGAVITSDCKNMVLSTTYPSILGALNLTEKNRRFDTLKVYCLGPSSVAITRNNHYIVSCSDDFSIRIWSLKKINRRVIVGF